MIQLSDDEARALTEARDEAWRFDVLNLQDQKIGELDGVTEGSFDFSVAATIRSSGSIAVTAQQVDWLKIRVQPWYTMTVGSVTVSWPVGVFIPASPNVDYATSGGTRKIELYDKLLLLDQDHTTTTYSVPAGANVTDTVRSLLQSVGETHDAITDSTATLRSGMVWEADTSKLKIINDLLDSINYFALWADGYGVFQGTPYTAPNRRGTAWTFADDEHGIYDAAFQVDEDTFNVPNVVGLVSTSNGDTAALTAEARNEDPNSPYSYQQRGRWISKVETEVEASSQAVLNSIAQRRLAELSAVTATYTISHAFIPLDLNDTVQFTREAEGITTAAVVQSMSISTAVGALVKTTLRGVVL